MQRYTASLFCRHNKWHFEVCIEADSLEEAKRVAYRDYADKKVKVINVVRG